VAPGDKSPDGLAYHFVVHGQAEVFEGGAPAMLSRIAVPYLGAEAVWPPPQFADAPGFVVRDTVDRVIGFGPWE
jgi:hypothetical protein